MRLSYEWGRRFTNESLANWILFREWMNSRNPKLLNTKPKPLLVISKLRNQAFFFPLVLNKTHTITAANRDLTSERCFLCFLCIRFRV
jgi:hypothetical protein